MFRPHSEPAAGMPDVSPIVATEGPPHRVLLVDDQAMIGEAVRRLVAGDPEITLHYCRDGRTALDAAAEFHPTVILQDLVMPGIDGLDLVRQYRAAPVTANVPVIMLSAEEQPVVKAQLLGAGANDYLVKLPDRVELVARIRVHSEAHRRLLERNAAFEALERSLAELKLEREKSERLLLSILPHKIAEQLKNGDETIAESFPQVTVLFADLAGFTEFSQNVDARNLVELLDEIFSAFDQLAAGLGVEKIKTIGDAYMAVAGLPVPRADHADAVAELALGMQEAFRGVRARRGLPLELRVGIHSGPVAAGVIGRQKFAYDLWGNTVNLASRMESSGEATRIHVSAATRALLGERFRFEDRGEVAIKGKGPMQTFFLLGRA
ncbi:MAG: response regulator [Planctomycetota bacterium]|nr:MAG: response regulator [Planctomycetota bacterium]